MLYDDIIVKKYDKERNVEFPKPDIAICSQCGWRGPVKECIVGEEGDWETGYYKIDLCPVCEDGGCIDDYDVSWRCYITWIINGVVKKVFRIIHNKDASYFPQ